MRPLGSLALAIALAFGTAVPANATPDRDRDRDRDRGGNTSPAPTAYSHGGDITPGNCVLGDDQKDLDINNVRARMYNNGNLFWRGGDPIYIVPAGGGVASIFAGGVWIGGRVGGELRVAAARYDTYEFWPGPLNADGTLPNPDNCEQYDRLFKVSRTDISDFEAGNGLACDLRDWPWQLGAPVIAAPNNGVDDNGDGDIDEGTDGIDNDGDGRVDERDEQERRTDGYDLAAGDRPDLIGDQAIWWVMNDVGNVHDETGTNPIGMEVRVQAFAFARADALNNVTFYKYTFVYRGQQPIEDLFLTIFSDPDLGAQYDDDYIGSNPGQGIGYIYNADNEDVGGYGTPPPALGYDFLQGPITPEGDTLQMTRFGYYNNNSGVTGEPANGQGYYRYMSGFWNDGQPWTEGGDGRGGTTPVDFVYPGDPTVPEYWSEFCPTPACGTPNTPDDRRFVMSTGPFRMEPGDVQEVVYAIVWATGDSNIGSVTAMFGADELAQTAYDLDFELPPPPDAPAVSATSTSGRVILQWSYQPNSNNYLGLYEQLDPFCVAAGNPEEECIYEFEGFNIYRYDSPTDSSPELVATYDVINGVTRVIDFRLDPATGEIAPFVAARGTDSGIQYTFNISNLTDYQDYYYGVSAYAHNELSVPKVLESPINRITVRPAGFTASGGGSFTQSEYGDVIVAERTEGSGAASLGVRVVDPTQVVAGTYTVRFYTFTDDQGTPDPSDDVEVPTYDISRDGTVVFNGRATYETTGRTPAEIGDSAYEALTSDRNIVVEGLEFFTPIVENAPPGDLDGVPDISGADGTDDAEGVVETAYAGNATTCPDPTNADDFGCEFYPGNTVWQDGNLNDDYYVSGGASGASVNLKRFIYSAAPDQFEMRFTAEGGYAIYYFTDDQVVRVPFEIWNIGSPDDPADDVRMIPFLNPAATGNQAPNWADRFPGTDLWAGSADICGGTACPITDWVYWMMPDRPNGYDLFEAAAIGFGGPGAIYDATTDGDTQTNTDPSTGAACVTDHYYVDFCYRNDEPSSNAYPTLGAAGGTTIYPIGRFVLADLARDGTTPPVGTTIRIITTPQPAIRPGDVFTFSTADLAFTTGSADTLQAAIDDINIVPNPYRGVSVYEAGGENRIARFVNLPDRATIRIFTISGTLIRTLQASSTRSLDWDLNTEAGLPVSSGMYLIHIEVKDAGGAVVGERVLKFGVVQRQVRFNNL